MQLDDLVGRITQLVERGKAVLTTQHRSSDGWEFVDTHGYISFRSGSLSFLLGTFGKAHPYYVEFDRNVETARPESIETGLGILDAARRELISGWTRSTYALISAEIFADMLDMAAYLLAEGYKDPAAVMVGSVLEEHIRQLCNRAEIPTEGTDGAGVTRPKKLDTLNADLAKAGVYSKGDQKNVTAWYDLRNQAAHGHYEKYTAQQVELLLQSVRDFITRNPA